MRIRTRIILGSLAFCFALLPGLLFAQAGKSGLSFLKLGVSGRGSSMADAMSAIVSGAASTYYNPAGLLNRADSTGAQLMIMHKEWMLDTRAEFLGANIPLSDEQAIGFAVNSTTVSDIEIRTRPGPAEGTFTARNFSLGVSYARVLSSDICLGITAKFLFEKILVDQASGFAVDLGAQYRTPIEDLLVGAAVANLGSLSQMNNEKTTLPTLLRAGPAYTFSIDNMQSNVTLASDVLYIFPEGRAYLNFGGELVFDRTVSARAGYRLGSEARTLSAGVGLKYGVLGLDYAYEPLSADLGNTHTVSLVLNLH
jgi:hypothetical protein